MARLSAPPAKGRPWWWPGRWGGSVLSSDVVRARVGTGRLVGGSFHGCAGDEVADEVEFGVAGLPVLSSDGPDGAAVQPDLVSVLAELLGIGEVALRVEECCDGVRPPTDPGSRDDGDELEIDGECFAGEWVVGVDDDVLVVEGDDGCGPVAECGVVAWLEPVGCLDARNLHDQFGVVFAEGVGGFDADGAALANGESCDFGVEAGDHLAASDGERHGVAIADEPMTYPSSSCAV